MIFMSIIEANIEIGPIIALSFKASTFDNSTPLLKCILWIYYLVYFKKNQAKIKVLLDFSNEINTITLVYISKQDFKIQSTNIKA